MFKNNIIRWIFNIFGKPDNFNYEDCIKCDLNKEGATYDIIKENVLQI